MLLLAVFTLYFFINMLAKNSDRQQWLLDIARSERGCGHALYYFPLDIFVKTRYNYLMSNLWQWHTERSLEMGKNTREMWELRNGFYRWLAEYLKEESAMAKELRQPSEERGRHKKGKIIGVVGSVTEAVTVKAEIISKLDDTNARLVAVGESAGLSVTPIKIKVEIICPVGDVALTSTAAERRISIEGKELKQEIESYINYLREVENPNIVDINEAKELYKSIKDNELYISSTDSGNGYRVTYYNGLDGRRQQQSVRDVLLIAGENTRLVDAPKRKDRADRAKQLGIYYRRLLGTDCMVLRRVYNFDKRYLDRRTQRLDNK